MYSKHEGKEFGSFVRTAGKFFNDEEQDKGKVVFIDNFGESAKFLADGLRVTVWVWK